jgi:hypothetical protein
VPASGLTPEELLAKAIKALKLRNLGLLKSKIEIDPDTVLGIDGNELEVQLKWGASKSEHLIAEDRTSKQPNQLFLVEITTSLRMLDKLPSNPAALTLGEPPKENEPKIRAELDATYIVTYEVDQAAGIEQPALDEFARRNVIYHVWPYWRAYITDILGRGNLPPFVLPMFALAKSSPKQ